MEIKVCEKCQASFECKADDIKNCICNIPLQKATLEFVAINYKNCLCANCLVEMDTKKKSS